MRKTPWPYNEKSLRILEADIMLHNMEMDMNAVKSEAIEINYKQLKQIKEWRMAIQN